MPELPEVETVRVALGRDLVGKKIKSVHVTNGRVVRRHASVKDFRALAEGRSVRGVARLGKYLVLGLDSGAHLIIHLGMSGQLLRAKGPKDPKPKHTHAVFSLSPASELRFVDPRTFGEMFVSLPPGEDATLEVSKFARLSIGGDGLALRRAVPELAHLGLDPLEDQFGWDRLAVILRSRTTALKAVLTDQDIICGIGNIYSDEILFDAGLRYDRAADSLSTIEIRRLHRAIGEILSEAIKHGGSTLSDEQFVDPDGHPGRFQELHQVYGREGLPCYQCRRPIERVTFHQRSTYYCANCQS